MRNSQGQAPRRSAFSLPPGPTNAGRADGRSGNDGLPIQPWTDDSPQRAHARRAGPPPPGVGRTATAAAAARTPDGNPASEVYAGQNTRQQASFSRECRRGVSFQRDTGNICPGACQSCSRIPLELASGHDAGAGRRCVQPPPRREAEGICLAGRPLRRRRHAGHGWEWRLTSRSPPETPAGRGPASGVLTVYCVYRQTFYRRAPPKPAGPDAPAGLRRRMA